MIEKDMFRAAAGPLGTCQKDVACYLKVLDTPVPATPPAAKMAHVKAAWMAAVLGGADTRAKLLDRAERIPDGAVRLALLEATAHLTPKGDLAAAERLEKLVASDAAAGNRVNADETYRVALTLRSRVP